MDNLRRRIPFRDKDDVEEEESVILDEQEQDELLASLKAANAEMDRKALIILKIIVAMSFVVQIATFVSPLSFLSILAHVNLFLIMQHSSRAFSFPLTYATAFVAPTLALFMGYPIAWWFLTPTVIFLIESMLRGIDKGTENLSALEGMRYHALGA